MLPVSALASFPVIAPHHSSSVISSRWAHWFGKWLLLPAPEAGRTDTMSWNAIPVPKQTSAKLLFTVRSLLQVINIESELCFVYKVQTLWLTAVKEYCEAAEWEREGMCKQAKGYMKRHSFS